MSVGGTWKKVVRRPFCPLNAAFLMFVSSPTKTLTQLCTTQGMSLKLVHECLLRAARRSRLADILLASPRAFKCQAAICRYAATVSAIRPRRSCDRSSATLPLSTATHYQCGYSNSVSENAHRPRSRTELIDSFVACPGCGALAQTIEPRTPGYYTAARKAIDAYVLPHNAQRTEVRYAHAEEDVFTAAIERVDSTLLDALDISPSLMSRDQLRHKASSSSSPKIPLCDRCHLLLHHHEGQPITHPSLQSIHDTISDSPYKYNHIYHVLDAADFPMSLLPRIHHLLDIAPQRSKNRRSKHAGFHHGTKTELSFIITRSDLLAPTREAVDKLMPYLLQVLRAALGYAGTDVRLGNVRCVSAKRGWWTRELKADIWRRGGGGWMVGKVNVGKSSLFEVAFPKGIAESVNFDKVRAQARLSHSKENLDEDLETGDEFVLDQLNEDLGKKAQDVSTDLLPPARSETLYPVMPTVSSLPGTTASPIRIPFGGGKGELIDLPGLARGNLEAFVEAEHRRTLMMKARLTPEQLVLRNDRALLLGGLFRLEVVNLDVDVLAYPFVSLVPRLTSKIKADEMHSGLRTSPNHIATAEAGARMTSAGRFKLKWDVTKLRAGPLTRASAVGLKASTLPFQVFSADILLEGIGWVELVAQVRRRARMLIQTTRERTGDPIGANKEQDLEIGLPEIEVFSPDGKFVGVRQPMNAWMLGGYGSRTKTGQKGRPRKSMAGTMRTRL